MLHWGMGMHSSTQMSIITILVIRDFVEWGGMRLWRGVVLRLIVLVSAMFRGCLLV